MRLGRCCDEHSLPGYQSCQLFGPRSKQLGKSLWDSLIKAKYVGISKMKHMLRVDSLHVSEQGTILECGTGETYSRH
jgi:hypothetical protein